MLLLLLLGLIQVASSNDLGSYVYGVKPLPDFDEVDPVSDTEAHYETISPKELKRLPRKVDGILKQGLDTVVTKVQNERNPLNTGFNGVNNEASQELGSQNFKTVGVSLSTRKPFLASKNYFGYRRVKTL